MLGSITKSLAIVAALAGCASTPPSVEVPVMLPCLGPEPVAPLYRFGVGSYPSTDAQAVALLWGDLVAAKQHAVDLQLQSAKCEHDSGAH